MPKPKPTGAKSVETLTHAEEKRKNIPTAEYQSVLEKQKLAPVEVKYSRGESAKALEAEKEARDRDLDPQLVWRGKDRQDWSDLVVHAPPLYIQEKVHAKALVDDLLRETRERQHEEGERTPDLFADFNGVPKNADKTEFYSHDQNWSNRMILGDSLQVMASLAEREGLRGKVQCIYFDPPYGIKFNSNFQWSTTSRDVKDGNTAHITREPEQVKAFRDTWRDGVNSYLSYLRDRFQACRDLLADSGVLIVQISDENKHRLRALLDEIFGDRNFISEIAFTKTGGFSSDFFNGVYDLLLVYGRDRESTKFRQLLTSKEGSRSGLSNYGFVESPDLRIRPLTQTERDDISLLPDGHRNFGVHKITGSGGTGEPQPFSFQGRTYRLKGRENWSAKYPQGMERLAKAGRLSATVARIGYRRYFQDFPKVAVTNLWIDTRGEMEVRYVVQTSEKVVERSILSFTDPGDLVLDPTCGSGTSAYVAEQWGRRWITIDTSRVALALARARIMGARYSYYLLVDSLEGRTRQAELSRGTPSEHLPRGSIRQGFVYERVPHVTLKSISNNAEIDVMWEEWQKTLEPLRERLNTAAKSSWAEWEVPREAGPGWSAETKQLHAEWWQARFVRQKAIDASIAAKAEFEFLYDRPYIDNKRVRVAGPFTVESLSPHRVLGVGADDELIDAMAEPSDTRDGYAAKQTFPQMILENLKTAGVQQAAKEGRIAFTSLVLWPGDHVCGEGRYQEGGEAGKEKRAAIFIGPEFGTVTRINLVEAAREAADAGFDVLIACAFNYEAHTTEFNKLGALPVLKARMNADLHMAEDLKNTGKGNLFVIFGEPDIDLLPQDDGRIRVKVNGVDVFHPATGEVKSDGPDGIACWFIDTDYNEESFFVRHAYFLGANDPYKALKTTLKAEIDEEAWATLNSYTSRAFPKPKS